MEAEQTSSRKITVRRAGGRRRCRAAGFAFGAKSRGLAAGLGLALLLICQQATRTSGQLPDDIQRELNQGLAEQARIQALRARHQQQMQARAGGQPKGAAGVAPGQPQPIDPNNYSFQQASPPVQYSYYQPYGDLAKPADGQQVAGGGSPQQRQQAAAPPINIDLNNLNIDIPNLPAPQAQVAAGQQANNIRRQAHHNQHLTPHFTGAGGLPVLQPVAAANQSPDTFAPLGQAPLQPQAQTAGGVPQAQQQQQQGPPLTEADFKDITGGENYGAPGGSDFGMGRAGGGGAGADGGEADQAAEPRAQSDNTDAQLREFGMPAEGAGQQQQQAARGEPRQDNPMAGMMPEFGGGFNPMGGGAAAPRRQTGGGGGGGFDPFAMAGGGGGLPFGSDFAGMGGAASPRRQSRPATTDFDFASQPSSQSEGAEGAEVAPEASRAGSSSGSSAPGSLQSLLGNAFPGLSGGRAGTMGLDALARGNNAPEAQLNEQAPRGQRSDDGALDIADLGDRSDGFSGADLGGFEQPSPQGDQDYNYAAAAEQQPRTVPYPDGGPQFVGTLLAVSQPQSMSQMRYNALPDKGTYQDYPAYQSGGNDFGAVADVVDGTPRARGPAPGRYGTPSPSQLAPEHRSSSAAQFDYAQGPLTPNGAGAGSASSLAGDFDEGENFVD